MKLVVLGEAWRSRLDTPLRSLGAEPFYLPENPLLDTRLRSHADLSFFPAGERVWLAPHLKCTEIHNILLDLGYVVEFPNISEQNSYPQEAALNLFHLGKRLFFSPKASDPGIVNSLTMFGDFEPISVKQGYLRCACLPVDDESMITADPGIARAARSAGLQVLQIQPGHVALEGYPYGFLGGAGFLLQKDTMVLSGLLDGHPDKGRIEVFLSQRGVTLRVATQEPVFDIGGAFVLESEGKKRP